MKRTLAFLFCISLVLSCQTTPTLEVLQEEIRQAEKDFNDMAAKKGLAEAFSYYAAEDAAISRGGRIIVGKEAIREAYQNATFKLTWSPDFIDVSASGDLAYTYGGYQLTRTDSLGNETVNTGTFHTVWKRQANGEWRFVYD